MFSRAAPEGELVAFEPTKTARMLERNLAASGVGNVQIRECALGETDGRRNEPIFRIWGEDPEQLEYEFSTVDREVARLGWDRLDLLKIDVDSFDFEVLKGAVETLRTLNPWVLVELNHALAKRHTGVAAALDWLARQGYEDAFVLDNENFLLRRQDPDDLAERDGLKLRHDREPVEFGDEDAL